MLRIQLLCFLSFALTACTERVQGDGVAGGAGASAGGLGGQGTAGSLGGQGGGGAGGQAVTPDDCHHAQTEEECNAVHERALPSFVCGWRDVYVASWEGCSLPERPVQRCVAATVTGTNGCTPDSCDHNGSLERYRWRDFEGELQVLHWVGCDSGSLGAFGWKPCSEDIAYQPGICNCLCNPDNVGGAGGTGGASTGGAGGSGGAGGQGGGKSASR